MSGLKREDRLLRSVTNRMGQIEGDSEKGDADGTQDALGLVLRAARRVSPR